MSLSFTFVDLLVVGVVIASAAYAGYRGLVSETLSIFAWAAAAFATLWFGPSVAPLAQNLVSSPILATVVGYALVFLIVLIPLSFLSFRFSQQVKSSQVGALDRVLGAAFGVLRGLAIIGFAYLILASFVKFEAQPEAVRNARTLPLMQASTEVILSLVPARQKTAESLAVVSPDAPSKSATAGTGLVPKPKPKGALAAKSSKKHQKTYGERDRRALDTLIETTGGNSTP
jgi:membrane protein required for colicin V production